MTDQPTTPQPLPQRDPGATFRKPPATVHAPQPPAPRMGIDDYHHTEQ